MKKLLILVIALALIGGVAMAQVAVSGEVEARIQRGDDGTHSQTFARVIVSGNVDEFNRVFIRMDRTASDVGAANLNVNRAHITTNLGAILGTTDAGVGISWNTGWNEWGYADVAEIDAYNWSGLAVSKPAGTGTKLSFNVMDMVNIHAAVRLLNSDMIQDDTAAVISLDGGIDVGVGTAVFELVFAQTPDDDATPALVASDNKQLGLAAGLVGFEAADGLTLGLTTAWTFELDAESPAPEWGFNVALQAAYAGLVSADFVLVGQDGSEANALGIGIGLSPVDFATLQFGVGIILDTEAYGVGAAEPDAFDSLDASVLFKLGRATARFGYYWLAEDTGVGIVPAEFARDNDFSGIYARVKLAF